MATQNQNTTIPNSDDEECLSEDLESDEEFQDSDEYEEDEQSVAAGKVKRKKPAHGGFILEEAEVDDLEDEGSEAEEGYQELLKEERHKLQLENQYPQRRKKAFIDMDDEKQLEELVAKFENRIVGDDNDSYQPMGAFEKQKPLPGINNPSLWMVRCQMGDERHLAFLIMRKALQCMAKNEPLNIQSVIQLDRLKGYLYIEAYNSAHLKQAIEGIYGLRFGLYKQKMVPIEEMTDVFRVIKNVAQIMPNSWVRFKRGLYRDDLAHVQSFDPIKSVATVKFLPRIDYSKLGDSNSKSKEKQYRFRPIAAIFDRDKAQNVGADVIAEGGYLVCKGRRFKRGFLIKRIHVSSLVTEGITPTLNELEIFNMTLEASDVGYTVTSLADHMLAVGDIVQVIEGELMNLLGLVISIDAETVLVQPNHTELKDPIRFGFKELIKYFKVGDHVKIIRGQNRGESGLVVRVENNQVIILSDVSIKEIKAFSRDIQLCTEKSISYDNLGKFTIHDFVQVDNQTIGVVVGIDGESISVLDQYEKILKTKAQNLIKKNIFGGMFIDQFTNKIFTGDTVRAVDGSHRGLRGQFKYYYKGFVFVFSKMLSSNSNMFVTRSKNLILDSSGERSINTSQSSMSYHNSKGSFTPDTSGSYVGIGRSPTVRRMMELSRDKSLIGNTVRVIKGPYKGHIGIVKDSTAVLARVELHTNSKTINVDRTNISLCGDDNSISKPHVKPSPISNKDHLARENIMFGGQTPQQDLLKTPRYGGMTPAQDGFATQIPGESAWEVNSTPRYPENFDDDIGRETILSSLNIPHKETAHELDLQLTTPSSAIPNSTCHSLTETPSPIFQDFSLANLSSIPTQSTSEGETPASSQLDISVDCSPALVPLEFTLPYAIGMEVSIASSFLDPDAAGKFGVIVANNDPVLYIIKTLNDNRALDNSSTIYNIDKKYLSLALPKINGKVTIAHRDKMLHGTLVGIDQNDGVVELDEQSKRIYDTDEDISLFLLKNIVSYIPIK
ncbi:hypothetical protein HZS_3939 [Henneguya salminicola]|nr:hypothetical protein HZS_3939 [Henneguya salminicola]